MAHVVFSDLCKMNQTFAGLVPVKDNYHGFLYLSTAQENAQTVELKVCIYPNAERLFGWKREHVAHHAVAAADVVVPDEAGVFYHPGRDKQQHRLPWVCPRLPAGLTHFLWPLCMFPAGGRLSHTSTFIQGETQMT